MILGLFKTNQFVNTKGVYTDGDDSFTTQDVNEHWDGK